ncbi:MAG: type II secretion system F family protein [Ruminococcus sp.]|nr:type II secretion system F family protein [Ruminococcus sp.]
MNFAMVSCVLLGGGVTTTMRNYSYVAKDSTGKTVKGVIEAEDQQQVQEKIYEQGLFLISSQEALGGSKGHKPYKFKTKELSFGCRQLAAMLTSGLTIVKALDIMYKETEKKGPKEEWLALYEDVNKGSSFTEALIARGGSFPDFMISMCDAGESSGNLDVTIQRLSDYYANSNKTQNTIRSAMMYPIILGVLTIVMVIGMFTFIMPTFAGLMDESEMPALSRALFNFSDFLKARWYVLVIAIVVIVLAIRYALKVPSIRLKYDMAIMKMPTVGPLVVTMYEGRFSRNLSSLYSSGIPMVECLERASTVLGNSYVDKMFLQVVDEVKQGSPVSTSLAKTELFEGMFCSMILVGEESGALDEILDKTADYYEEEADAAVKRLVALLEPLMIIIMGLVIGVCLAGIFPLLYGGIGGLEDS